MEDQIRTLLVIGLLSQRMCVEQEVGQNDGTQLHILAEVEICFLQLGCETTEHAIEKLRGNLNSH